MKSYVFVIHVSRIHLSVYNHMSFFLYENHSTKSNLLHLLKILLLFFTGFFFLWILNDWPFITNQWWGVKHIWEMRGSSEPEFSLSDSFLLLLFCLLFICYGYQDEAKNNVSQWSHSQEIRDTDLELIKMYILFI